MYALPLLLAATLPTADDIQTRVIARINAQRKAAGLEPVAADADLSKGCQAHARYLARNLRLGSTRALNFHAEDPKLPGYTEEGAKAAMAAVVAAKNLRVPDQAAVIDEWLATFHHRIPFLHPAVRRVGFGMADQGGARFFVLDVQTDVARNPVAVGDGKQVVLWPADMQTDVPRIFWGQELPDPIPAPARGRRVGYPVTASVPRGVPVKEATAVLREPGGKEVAAWLSTPERPANQEVPDNGNAICLLPGAPLKPATTYEVEASAVIGGKKWSRTWSFTTARR